MCVYVFRINCSDFFPSKIDALDRIWLIFYTTLDWKQLIYYNGIVLGYEWEIVQQWRGICHDYPGQTSPAASLMFKQWVLFMVLISNLFAKRPTGTSKFNAACWALTTDLRVFIYITNCMQRSLFLDNWTQSIETTSNSLIPTLTYRQEVLTWYKLLWVVQWISW